MIVRNEDRVLVQVSGSDLNGYLEFLPSSGTGTKLSASLWFLDVLLHAKSGTEDVAQEHPVHLQFTQSIPPIANLFASILESFRGNSKSRAAPVRFLFSTNSGYVAQSNFLEQRLECSQTVAEVYSFVRPLQYVAGVLPENSKDSTLEDLLALSLGAILPQSTHVLEDLDSVLQDRLSFPWLLPSPPKLRRLAWVQGREDIDCIERALKAAKALGIKLVVLDEPGHWLQDPSSPWAYLREAFVEIDITPDEGLTKRIVDAVQSYPEVFDGIVTISDIRLPSVARACRILHLPTESAEAYDIAGDKGKTRLLEPVGADESFVLSHADELEPHLEALKHPLRFPLVVKPVIGWCSDCVSKVSNHAELVIAVRKASERHAESAKASTTVVIEPYIDGPEVDANLALLDGEILFFDINDDFPSPADARGASLAANFQETQNVIPSGLPNAEIAAIRDQMRDSILRQGFRSGIFHCEARVRNSRYQYACEDGIVDLMKKSIDRELGKTEVYLHEINARPPGYLETVAVLLAYGVDYYSLRMLLALGPEEVARVRALAQPFLSGPQFHLSLMIIQQTTVGVMKTRDAAKEFLEKHPHLNDSIVDYYTRKKGGDILEGPDASALWWIAYFSVISRDSRRELLERVEFIQQNFEYELEE